MSTSAKKATFKTVLWSIFSATLAFVGLFLPVHIWAQIQGKEIQSGTAFTIFVFALYIATLYLALYRLYTLLLDLGLEKYHKILGIIFVGLFVIGVGLLVANTAVATTSAGA